MCLLVGTRSVRAVWQAPALTHVLVTAWGEHFDLSQVPPNLLCCPSAINRTGRENLRKTWIGARTGELLPSWAQQTHTGEITLLPMKQSRVMRN